MRNKQRIKQIASAVLALMIAAVPVSASVQEMPDGVVTGTGGTGTEGQDNEDTVQDYDGSRTGRITIDYREKDDEGRPVQGAVFRYYKIADLVTETGGASGTAESAAENTADASSGSLSEAYTGSRYQSVIDGITVNGDTLAEDIRDAVLFAYKDASVAEGTTDANGYATTELAPGAYMGVEVKPEIGYLPSDPFLFAVPEGRVNGDVVDGWNYHVTVYPKAHPVAIGTTLTWNGIHEADEESAAELRDRVKLTGLVPGRTYYVKGRLWNADTKQMLDSTSEVKFTAENSTEVKDLPFTLNTAGQAGLRMVAFEDLYIDQVTKDTQNPGADETDEWNKKDQNLVHTATHHDFTDQSQTVHVVKIGTTLTTADGVHELDAKTNTLTDSVFCKGLIKGHAYRLSGELMDADAKASTGMTSSVRFTATASTVIVRVPFRNLDLSKWSGKKLVAFEALYDLEGKDETPGRDTDSTASSGSTPAESGTASAPSALGTDSTPSGDGTQGGGTLITKHEDYGDKNQTVHVVKIGTVLTGPDSAKTIGTGKTTLTDTVSCKGLTPGRTYQLVGELMSKSKQASAGVTSKTQFTAQHEEETVTITFKDVDLSAYSGDSLVAFETLYGYRISTDGTPTGTDSTPSAPTGSTPSNPKDSTPKDSSRYQITEHKDLDDADQTVSVTPPGTNTPGTNTPGNGTIGKVKTSDTIRALVYIGVIAAAVAVIVLAGRKSRKNKKNGTGNGPQNPAK